MGKLSVIIVNWNTRQLLEQCLKSVYASASGVADLEVLVVDNRSTDGSVQMVASRFPAAIIISNSQNVGFAKANNLAISRAKGDYLLLLNPDTEVVDAAIPQLLRFAEAHPDVAVTGPQLLNTDGTVQPSRRRFPTAATALLESTILQRWMPDHPTLQRFYVLDRSDDQPQEVDWVVGAGLLVRASAARQVGLMDEDYFMYSEEMDWCHRFVGAGWKVVYYPTAQLIHHGGQSSDQDLFHRHTRFQHSKCLYFEKHHSRSFAQLLRIFLLANYTFLLLEDVAKLFLLRRKRSMRRQRISILARVVAWEFWWVLRWGRIAP